MTMLSINTNVGALQAASASYSVNKSMETSMHRLSTGKRINSAADDAAGHQIANRLTAEIQGLKQAIRNAADAQALMGTAEGAIEEIQLMRQVDSDNVCKLHEVYETENSLYLVLDLIKGG